MLDSNLFQIIDNKIKFDNGKIIEFEFPIYIDKTVSVDFAIIIILKVPPKIKYNNNVFAVSTSGNLLWQIEPKNSYIQNNDCPFVEIKINDEEKLELFNWCSIGFTVEPFTGKILNKYTTQ